MGQGVVLVEVTRFLPQNSARFAEPDYEDQEVKCENCDGDGIIENEKA